MNEPFSYYFIAGLVISAVSVPLLQGWIPRNRWSGFRTPKTLSSDRIWYEANRIAGRNLMIAGVVIMVAAFTGWVFAQQIPGLPYEKIIKAAFFVAMSSATLHSFIALRRL